MIRHLNSDVFRPFGTILPTNSSISHKPNHHSVSLGVDTTSRYRTVASLWLAEESGLVVLSVSADGTNYLDFYLDRPVQLRGGVWFRLTGLQGRCGVQMGGSAMPSFFGTRANDRDFTVRPNVCVDCLYTLFYQEKEQSFVFPGEAHSMAELLYVDQGALHSVVDGQDLILNKGELMLYAPNQWHMQYADVGQAPRLVTISFDARGLCWEQLQGRSFQADPEQLSLLQQILRQQELAAEDSVDKIFCMLTMLLLSLQAQKPGAENSSRIATVNGENAIIRRAQQYIQEHVEEKLTVPVAARNVGVSPSYLTALFHKHLQISPGEYIRRIKLQQSKQLIREGQMNFTQIAESLQYSTVHHFSRQFKQMFGITPTEYAKSVR